MSSRYSQGSRSAAARSCSRASNDTSSTRSTPPPRPVKDMSNEDSQPNKRFISLPPPSIFDLKARCRAYRIERNLNRYYKQQKTLIDCYHSDADPEHAAHQVPQNTRLKVDLAIYWSIIMNVVVFLIQLVAAIKTRYLILAAGAADSLMDLLCSLALVGIAQAAKKSANPAYPAGLAKVEPVGILMFCCLAINVGIQLIIESIRRLATHGTPRRELLILPLTLLALSVLTESALALYLFFNRRIPMIKVLYLSTRNDLVLSVFSLLATALAKHSPWWFDPSGALCIGLFMITSWAEHSIDHARKLVGIGASSDLVSRILFLITRHSDEIVAVKHVRVYHAGEKNVVEACVIVDNTMLLDAACDLKWELERKMEGLVEVERAFVGIVIDAIVEETKEIEGEAVHVDSPRGLFRKGWDELWKVIKQKPEVGEQRKQVDIA